MLNGFPTPFPFNKADMSMPFPFRMPDAGDKKTEDGSVENGKADGNSFQPWMLMFPMLWMPQLYMQSMSQWMQCMQWMTQRMTEMTSDSAKSLKGGLPLDFTSLSGPMLQKLLSLDASPENLEKLQKALDLFFAACEKIDGKDRR